MSSTPNPKQSNNLPGFDPMMGQLEVIEPGIAMFHGFANESNGTVNRANALDTLHALDRRIEIALAVRLPEVE